MAVRSETLRGSRSRASKTSARSRLPVGHPATLISVVSILLVVLGLVMILSASSVSAFANYGSSFTFFKKQAIWATFALIAFAIVSRTDYRKFRRLGYPAIALVSVLMAAVLIPGVGVMVGGSSRWLSFGPLSVQPSELAKLALILLIADVLARKQESSLQELGHTIVPVIPVMGILTFLVMMQPDLGTTLLLGFIGMGMLFVAAAPLRYILPIGVLGAAGAVGAALSADYRRARILAFLDPWSDPLNTGYQAIQSMIALGSGGWFGVGLGASRQKWMYIPNAHTDFIFAILGEEMGLIGTLVVLGMFAFRAYAGIQVARFAPDRFGMLLAAGITIWITVQAIVNIGAVTAALPITGVPVPLVSFGGSSLVVTMVGVGMLANVARQSSVPAARSRSRRKK